MSKTVNFAPMHGAVLVELPEIDETTKGGIIKSDEMVTEERSNHDGFLTVVAAAEDAPCEEGMQIMANLMQCSMISIDAAK
jgi:co-chaperonin GroES (HSP10)